MSRYELEIHFSIDDVRRVDGGGAEVAISQDLESDVPVIWLAFRPFEFNAVTWGDEIGAYASNTEIATDLLQGKEFRIEKFTGISRVEPGFVYPFVDGLFLSAKGGGAAGHYTISNRSAKRYTFGLMQSAEVNGEPFEASPINAVEIDHDAARFFPPARRIHVFLRTGTERGEPIEVDFTDRTRAVIHYDASRRCFASGGLGS